MDAVAKRAQGVNGRAIRVDQTLPSPERFARDGLHNSHDFRRDLRRPEELGNRIVCNTQCVRLARVRNCTPLAKFRHRRRRHASRRAKVTFAGGGLVRPMPSTQVRHHGECPIEKSSNPVKLQRSSCDGTTQLAPAVGKFHLLEEGGELAHGVRERVQPARHAPHLHVPSSNLHRR